RHAPAGGRRGPALDPGAPRPLERLDHPGLHAGRAWTPAPRVREGASPRLTRPLRPARRDPARPYPYIAAMAAKPPDRIRNVVLIGHRGSGKTSLCEALLFEAGVINRLGRVEDGSTVTDAEPDEQERGMSIDAGVVSFEYSDRKLNLIDTPGESSFVADTLA